MLVRRVAIAVAVGTLALSGTLWALVEEHYQDRISASIEGRLLDAATKRGVANAVVSLGAVGQVGRPIARRFSDGTGRFVLAAPVGGSYSVTAVAPGFFDAAFGRVVPGGVSLTTIDVVAGQTIEGVDILMWRGAGISGTVIDEGGAPVGHVPVQAITRRWIAGAVRVAAGPVTRTDEFGHYRLGQLLPGDYEILVPPSALPAISTSKRTLAYGESFGAPGPGVRSVIRAVPGEEHRGINVHLASAAAYRVAGAVSGAGGQRLRARLVPADLDGLGMGLEAGTTTLRPDGSFEFSHVPAGRYIIDLPLGVGKYGIVSSGWDFSYGLRLPRPHEFPQRGINRESVAAGPAGAFVEYEQFEAAPWARVDLTVTDRDITGLSVPLRQGASLRGRVDVDTDSNSVVAADPAIISLHATDGDPARARRSAVSRRIVFPPQFQFEGLMPGGYAVRVESRSLSLKSVTVGGRSVSVDSIHVSEGSDVHDVVVTLTSRMGVLSGTVRGTPLEGAAVIVFTADPDRWVGQGLWPAGIRSVRASSSGRFVVPGLSAGDWLAVAVPILQESDWQELSFLQRASAVARRVALKWDAKVTSELTLTTALR